MFCLSTLAHNYICMVYENVMIVSFEYFHYMLECPPGFFAKNCSRECPYPYYGEKCILNCSCDREHCNFMVGCETGKYIYCFIASKE